MPHTVRPIKANRVKGLGATGFRRKSCKSQPAFSHPVVDQGETVQALSLRPWSDPVTESLT